MTKRMNWRSASLAGKRVLSTKDEADYRDQDAAARWLERNEKPKGKRSGKARFRAKPVTHISARRGAA